jgi:hypothetical protein
LGLSALLLAIGLALARTSQASAQCGSQASSCKNCHEVQGQMPVNDQGEWHTAHAFGDFCEFCHAGNVQSMDQGAAHSGMVDPLADVEASCAACHPDDARALGEIYAAALGVALGEGEASGGTTSGAGGNPGRSAANDPVSSEGPPPLAPAAGGLVIDFNQRYEESVVGRPVNWGNVILGAMIVLVAAGGGAYVVWNERRLRAAAKPVRQAVAKPVARSAVSRVPEIEELLPRLQALNPLGRRGLARLLEDPETASDLLYRLSRLDPQLVRELRGLDRETRSLLLALAND